MGRQFIAWARAVAKTDRGQCAGRDRLRPRPPAPLPPPRGPFRSAIVLHMHADQVEVSWSGDKHKWLVRIEVGAEVIRRYCEKPRDAGEEELRSAAAQTVIDEGYEIDQSRIAVRT